MYTQIQQLSLLHRQCIPRISLALCYNVQKRCNVYSHYAKQFDLVNALSSAQYVFFLWENLMCCMNFGVTYGSSSLQ